MKNVEIRWFAFGALAFALSACEVSVGKCRKDDAGECVDLFDDEDAGDEEDAGDDLDAGRADAGRTDAGRADGGDASRTDGGGDAGADGGGGGDGSASLTIDEFCEAYLSRALAWRDLLAECCLNEAIDDRESLLASVFLYGGDTTLTDCIDNIDDQVTADRVDLDTTKLQSCADEFAKQLPEAPSSCPAEGFDLDALESTAGHGLQRLPQIPVCREALAGKVKRDQICTDSLECIAGLRCMPAPGNTRTCQPAAIEECVNTAQCEDETICVGQLTSGGKTCVSVDELPLTSNQRCDLSSECANDLLCRVVSSAGGVDRNGCVPPTSGTFVCKQ
jgi:hypothetical protein